MRIEPLRQAHLIDVTDWEPDAEFGVYPQGARAKEAVFVPAEPPDSALVANKRYLFKRSKKSYPDQFWGEIVAYRIGCLMGLDVPPAFAAWNSYTGFCGALIEWFYLDGQEYCILAGEFLQKIQPDFDRNRGSTHNLRQNQILMRAFQRAKLLDENLWRQWWTEALLFDAVIGNTDRHQDNWGFLFPNTEDQEYSARFTPLFDNGTSLGHERFINKVQAWKEADYLRYIAKGRHHISWSMRSQESKDILSSLNVPCKSGPKHANLHVPA